VKLYLKQQPLSFQGRFSVRDDSDREVLTCEGEIFSWGRKIHLFDQKDKEVALVREEVPSFRPRFSIEIKGREVGRAVQRFALIGTRFDIDGLDWVAEGSFDAHEYNVSSSRRTVMDVRKAWFSWGDSYELEIAAPDDALAAVCVMLAIDLALDSQAGKGLLI